jgi:EF hand
MTSRALVLAAILAATLSACASGPPDGGPGGREGGDFGAPGRGGPGGPDGPGGPGGPGGGPLLFISPAGEPFRAPPGHPYPVTTWFAGADANHDGAVSRDEFVADSLRFFAVVDADHNGVIDGFEVSAYETRIAPEIVGGVAPSTRRGPMGQGPGGGGGPPGGGMGPGGGDGPSGARRRSSGSNMLQGASLYGLIAEPEPVMGADADFNRRITKDEATKAAKTRFALLDLDKDGLLKLEELPKTPAQRMAEGGKGRDKRGGRPPPR